MYLASHPNSDYRPHLGSGARARARGVRARSDLRHHDRSSAGPGSTHSVQEQQLHQEGGDNKLTPNLLNLSLTPYLQYKRYLNLCITTEHRYT